VIKVVGEDAAQEARLSICNPLDLLLAVAKAGLPRGASRRVRTRTRAPRQILTRTRSDQAPHGGKRYGLRPARLPPRDQHDIKEVNEDGNEEGLDLHLSTADHLKVGLHPWLNIRSARWL
jgi:hypothetical protein